MARLSRFVLPGQPQHVIQRGNNRQNVFFAEDDYRFYLEKLANACRRYDCRVHSYVLMTNHVHLLITPMTETGIGKVMQSLGRSYVQYVNFRHRRTGTLWEGRYRATLLDSERYLLTCHRYIELNPVRAGMVADPAAYPWSSYRHNALGEPDELVSPHALYEVLGENGLARQQAYRELFDEALGEPTLEEIRQATNKAWILGDDRFRDRIQALLGRPVRARPRGGDRRSKEFREKPPINRV
jgi:putative transposase